jgi:hypothetical protein
VTEAQARTCPSCGAAESLTVSIEIRAPGSHLSSTHGHANH